MSIRDLDQELAKELRLDRPQGVYVNGLSEGGAAKDAGVRSGDVIVRIGAVPVNTVPQLQEQIGKFKPGDRRLPVTIFRSGQENVVEVTLRGREGQLATKLTEE